MGIENDESTTNFPIPILLAVKLFLMNCSFFHRPTKTFEEIRTLLKNDGDFLIQDYADTKLLLSIRFYGRIYEYPIAISHERKQIKFEFLGQHFDQLEQLALAFTKSNGKGGYIETENGDQLQLIRPIHRTNYAGRLGYGECVNVRDCVRRNKIHPSFIRSLRIEFANSQKLEDDLEKLVSLDHPNLVRLCDFHILPIAAANNPLVFVRFDQVPSVQTLFDRLFNQGGVLNSRRYVKWTYQAAKGINYLMDRGILHRRLNARCCLLDSMQNLRLSDFWTENNPDDLRLFQRKVGLPNAIGQSSIIYKDGWRYLPAETLTNGIFDSTSQVWTFALLVWQIYTHCQFGNRIYYANLHEFLSIASARDDPYFMPGHLSAQEAQQGMPEQRRRKMIFRKASERLPHAPESFAQIIPRALLPDRSKRPFFTELFRMAESEKRILDAANLLSIFL